MTTELADPTRSGCWGPQRSKTVSWHEPRPTTATGLSIRRGCARHSTLLIFDL
jgi:hypothetical protein